MAQGSFKVTKNVTKANSAKAKKAISNAKTARKGNPDVLAKGRLQAAALDDRDLTRAINKQGQQRVAGKLIQDGGKLTASDLVKEGKELNREQRRNELKKKVGRVQEKLKILESKMEE